MSTIIINDELKNLLPPLSAEEFVALEQSILEYGCRVPLIVWNNILVDGHHRYEICRKYAIPFSTQTIVLDDLDDAKFWIYQHRDESRKLTPFRRAELVLGLKATALKRIKIRQGLSGDQAQQKAVPPELPESGTTVHQGLPWTPADRRRALMLVVKHFPNKSNREIAEVVGYSLSTVQRYRSSIRKNSSVEK